MIARCPRAPLPDGVRAAIQLTDDDPLCLDGQLLVLLDGEHFADGAVYRTERDSLV